MIDLEKLFGVIAWLVLGVVLIAVAFLAGRLAEREQTVEEAEPARVICTLESIHPSPSGGYVTVQHCAAEP